MDTGITYDIYNGAKVIKYKQKFANISKSLLIYDIKIDKLFIYLIYYINFNIIYETCYHMIYGNIFFIF